MAIIPLFCCCRGSLPLQISLLLSLSSLSLWFFSNPFRVTFIQTVQQLLVFQFLNLDSLTELILNWLFVFLSQPILMLSKWLEKNYNILPSIQNINIYTKFKEHGTPYVYLCTKNLLSLMLLHQTPKLQNFHGLLIMCSFSLPPGSHTWFCCYPSAA